MARPVTLFTGQWADLPLEELAAKCASGASTASSSPAGATTSRWTRRFATTPTAARSGAARAQRTRLLAIGTHLVGQAVCDLIDSRHQGVLPEDVWGDGHPEGVRQRAAEKMKDTACAAARLGVSVVTGFTGSPVWHMLYSFPPNDWDDIARGYEDFAERWNPIIDVFDQEGVRFALEVHPTEIAYDFPTTQKTLEAIGHREGFGINFDPSHFEHQFLDSATFVGEFADRIYHVHVKDSKKRLNGRRSILGSHIDFGEPERGWTFVSPGHGDVDFEDLFRQLNRIGYEGRSRSSGRTRAWTATGARPTRSPSYAAPTSRRPRWRSTRRLRGSGHGRGEGQHDGRRRQRRRRRHDRRRDVGYAFMGKAHSNAYKTLSYMTWPPPLMPQLVSIAGRDEAAVSEAAARYGFEGYVTDWHELIGDERIGLFDNSGPNNLHTEPSIAPPRPAST